MKPDIEAIRQSPRQYVDLGTVEQLADYAMLLELQRDELMWLCEVVVAPVMEAHAGPSRLDTFMTKLASIEESK